jgi:thymidylate kinase
MKKLPLLLFIAVVGPNFTGKSTVTTKLAHELHVLTGRRVTVCKLYNSLAERELADKLLSGFEDQMEHIYHYCKFFRRQRRKIEIALLRGDIVIAERFSHDAEAAMSHGDIVSKPALKEALLDDVFGKLKPNITFLLKISSCVAEVRYQKRDRDALSHNDKKHLKLHDRVSEAYDLVAKKTGAISISSEGTVDETVRLILKEL